MKYHLQRRVGQPRTVNGKQRPGHVTYTVRVFVDKAHGGPRRFSPGTCRLERDANALGVATVDSFLAGTYREPSALTVREIGARWLRESVGLDKAPNTLRHHESNLKGHVYPTFGERVAEQVRAEEVSAWQADQLDHGRRDGKGAAMKSLLDYRGTLHALYAWAVELGLVAANPVASARAPRHKARKPIPPTVEAMRTFVDAMKHAPRIYVPTFLLAATGMRRGELLAVRWQDVTLKQWSDPATGAPRYAGRFRIHPDRGNLTGPTRALLRFGPPKTRKGSREVELPEYAAAWLARHRGEQRARFGLAGLAWGPDTLVCCGGEGQPIVPDGLTHELARFRRRHDLPRIHPHLLRHAVATAMLEAGVAPEAVAEHLGHATITTTVDTYNHVRTRVLRDAAARYGMQWTAGSGDRVKTENGHQVDTKAPRLDELAERRRRKEA